MPTLKHCLTNLCLAGALALGSAAGPAPVAATQSVTPEAAALSPGAWAKINAQLPAAARPLLALPAGGKKLTAADGAAGDRLGWAVALDGDVAVVGVVSDTVGANVNQGSAYVFMRNQGGPDAWGQVKQLVAGNGQAQDGFGHAVAVDGDVIVVGAIYADVTTTVGITVDQGSTYVFYRNQGGPDAWGQVKQLVASDGAADDQFGAAVGVSGDVIVVSAWKDDVSSAVDQGSAYVFMRTQGGPDAWGQVKHVFASAGAAGDQWGGAAAVSGEVLVVGAYLDDVDENPDQGSADVFVRNQGGSDNWGWVKQLLAGDGSSGDWFGCALSASGDVIVVGASGNVVAPFYDVGAAYVFYRNQGGLDAWGQVKRLLANDRADYDRFGSAVAVSGDKIVVGAPYDDLSANADQGSVYAFDRNWGGSDNWGQVQHWIAADGAAGDRFGGGVAISGDLVLAGAALADVGGQVDQGAAYLYQLKPYTYLPMVLKDAMVYFEGPFENEDNDAYTSANGPLRAGKVYTGTFDDAKDYYSVYLRASGTISATAAHDRSGVQMQLFYQVADVDHRLMIDYTGHHVEYDADADQLGWYYIYLNAGTATPMGQTYTVQVTYP